MAARFDSRPGFSLVDFEEVGLPIYRLTAIVLTLQPKYFPPIEEFVLKTIEAGLLTPPDVAGLLGVDQRIIEASLTNLIQNDLIFVNSDGTLAITRKTQEILQGEAFIRPREQTISFYFDALIRKARHYGSLPLVTPANLKSLGIREIRGFPARKPDASEIDVRDLDYSMRAAAGPAQNASQLLRIREVGRKENYFLRAIALIYKSKTTDEVRVGFAVDGRLWEEHEHAFSVSNGPAKLGIVDSVLSSDPRPELAMLLGDKLASELSGYISEEGAAERHKQRSAVARFKAELSRKSAASKLTLEARREEEAALGAAMAEVQESEKELAGVLVRPIAVYEHPPLLEEAVRTALHRVLIISPWIAPAVVGAGFIKHIYAALERGVKIYIGYGLDGTGASERPMNSAESELKKVAERNSNFHLARLGNTHAKVLVKDSDFFVVTSFNWLSFKGDPRRAFREEWGTYVGIRRIVDRYAEELLKRFSSPV